MASQTLTFYHHLLLPEVFSKALLRYLYSLNCMFLWCKNVRILIVGTSSFEANNSFLLLLQLSRIYLFN